MDDEAREAAARDEAFSRADDAWQEATMAFIRAWWACRPDGNLLEELAQAKDYAFRTFDDLANRLRRRPSSEKEDDQVEIIGGR